MMKKLIAIAIIALFSVTAAFAADTATSAGTPVPSKSCKKMHKHHGKKCKTANPAATPAAK